MLAQPQRVSSSQTLFTLKAQFTALAWPRSRQEMGFEVWIWALSSIRQGPP